MHFVTGGAFNGKRKWVMKNYIGNKEYTWLSAYENASFPTDITVIGDSLIILEGIECWLRELTEQHESAICRDIWNQSLTNWLSWEQAAVFRKIIVIGTDISKGIVPLEVENRLWRDVTGWAFQDTAAMSETVDIIWYGIQQNLK